MMQTGLVLVGGGARAAYQADPLKEILERRKPTVFCNQKRLEGTRNHRGIEMTWSRSFR